VFYENCSFWKSDSSRKGDLHANIEGNSCRRIDPVPRGDHWFVPHGRHRVISGHQLDTMIRQHLWLAGFDYPAIETGHGVSHGLGIIQGGASISSVRSAVSFGLKEGMIVSIGRLTPARELANRRSRSISSLPSRNSR
jgi:hypothetical protein